MNRIFLKMKSMFYYISVFSVIGKNLLKTLKLNDKLKFSMRIIWLKADTPECIFGIQINKIHLRFLNVLNSLIAHFLFSADYCSIVWMYYSSFVHLLKDISVVCKFWQLWIKLLYISMYRFLCRYVFDSFE